MADKGVIVEYDFAAMDGAELLFGTTKSFLKALDKIRFDEAVEARHFAGRSYQDGFAEYFPLAKTKKTAVKAAREFEVAVRTAFTTAVPKSVNASFANFVKTLVAKQVKVVISTRADLESVRESLTSSLPAGVEFYHEDSATYGSQPWDAWRRTCVRTGLRPYNVIAVAGFGNSVRSALRGGLGSVAVMNSRTDYQDYTGCNECFKALDTAAAKKILEILRA